MDGAEERQPLYVLTPAMASESLLGRALFYLLAVSTGMRRKGLMGLTIGHVHANPVPTPFFELLT